MNLKLNINQISNIVGHIDTLRVFPGVSWALAKQLFELERFLKKILENSFEEQRALLQIVQSNLHLRENAPDEFKKLLAEEESNLNKMKIEKLEIELQPLSDSDFSKLEIDGFKELLLTTGQFAKFSYRDAYFALVEAGIIA